MPVTKVAKKLTAKRSATEKRMGMPEIKAKARSIGINPGNMKKSELIRTIQVTEGYEPCFGRSNGQCGNTDCCFMKDCLSVKQ